MKKIVFGITSLGVGGAERVLLDIVNELDEKYDITLFTLYSGGAFEKELSEKIKLISLNKSTYEDLGAIKKRLIPLYILICGKSIYKKYIKDKYDVEISFLEGPITRLFRHKSIAKKIAWIHTDISKIFGRGIKAKIKKKVDKGIYKKYDKIVFVSIDSKEKFNDLYETEEFLKNEEIIYNYINKERILKKASEDTEKIDIEENKTSIVTVARLVKPKAIDRFIKVHKKLIEEGFIHNVYIIGDGPEKDNLEKQIKDLKVEETFKLLGQKENPYPYIKKTDYFALLSEYEGYGMVIEESKILNKNIIITNTGAKEAIEGYDKSIIVENNEEAIYEGLKQILSNNIVFNNKENVYDNSNLLEEVKRIIEVE